MPMEVQWPDELAPTGESSVLGPTTMATYLLHKSHADVRAHASIAAAVDGTGWNRRGWATLFGTRESRGLVAFESPHKVSTERYAGCCLSQRCQPAAGCDMLRGYSITPTTLAH